MNQAFLDATSLLEEGYTWMPQVLLIDLVAFHALVRLYRRRGQRIE